MQEELGISLSRWGWVTGMFTLAYCLFEIPAGVLGDRIGARRMLTRIVLWWSGFTALTGMVSSLPLLLITRFCFGAGQAGAYPSSAIVISRWFPKDQRASISGITLMAGQLGGALAPLLIIPIQMRYGWRASFHVFAVLGLVWAATWYWWFRESPARSAPTVAAASAAKFLGARHFTPAHRACAGAHLFLLHLLLQLLPDVAPYLSREGARIHGSGAALFIVAVRSRRLRDVCGRLRQRRTGAQTWHDMGTTSARNGEPGTCRLSSAPPR